MQRVSQATGLKGDEVKCSYLENEDTLHTHLTDKPFTRETSPNWHTNSSYAKDGSIVEVVLLDFSTLGKLNQQLMKAQSASCYAVNSCLSTFYLGWRPI